MSIPEKLFELKAVKELLNHRRFLQAAIVFLIAFGVHARFVVNEQTKLHKKELKLAKQDYENRIRAIGEGKEQWVKGIKVWVSSELVDLKEGIGKLDVAPSHEGPRRELIDNLNEFISALNTWVTRDVRERE